ncbi:MAG: ABC transporter substrate-binding protein, partial [Chloroflexi bacterium]|nr:ABC transporter substrate-binding protein [Chloroflexota bacterium]
MDRILWSVIGALVVILVVFLLLVYVGGNVLGVDRLKTGANPILRFVFVIVGLVAVGVIYYADNGLDVYGNAFLANPAFLQAKPDAVRAFVRAAARGWRDAIA